MVRGTIAIPLTLNNLFWYELFEYWTIVFSDLQFCSFQTDRSHAIFSRKTHIDTFQICASFCKPKKKMFGGLWGRFSNQLKSLTVCRTADARREGSCTDDQRSKVDSNSRRATCQSNRLCCWSIFQTFHCQICVLFMLCYAVMQPSIRVVHCPQISVAIIVTQTGIEFGDSIL